MKNISQFRKNSFAHRIKIDYIMSYEIQAISKSEKLTPVKFGSPPLPVYYQAWCIHGTGFFIRFNMPNRVIRSGFLDSEKINSLKYDEQLFFVRLMLVADDFGCFDARETMIKSACYPVTDIRLTDVSKWLSAVCNAGLVSIYESCGKKFLLINNFEQRLRQKRRKYPEPIELQNMSDTCQSIDGHLHATMPESESESESESEKKTPISPKRDCEFFNSFWQLYPKKVGKGAVEKAWSKIKQPEYTLEQIKTALAWQMQSEQWTKESGQYIPMPSTYLNQRRWEDEKIVTAQTIKTGPKELTSADCENLYKDN